MQKKAAVKKAFSTEISVADLKKIWAPEAQGKINKWSDVNSTWEKITTDQKIPNQCSLFPSGLKMTTLEKPSTTSRTA